MLDLPFAYRLTMVCLNSLVYLGLFFVDIFTPSFCVFYYSLLVHFFGRGPKTEKNEELREKIYENLP